MKKGFLSFLSFFLFFSIQSFCQSYPQKDLKILSWNIHMLPSLIYHKTKKIKRAKGISEELLKSDYNILVLQEAFHRRARKKIRKRLKEKFPFVYGPANTRFLSFKANSGVWILSDRPLIYLNETKYSQCEGDGCLARKGALMMEGEHFGNRFQLIGTHNNGGWVNNSQFHQIRHELLDPFQKENVVQLICGDFNTKKTTSNRQWETMISLFDADLQYIQTDARSDLHKKHWEVADIYQSWPDFIFVRPNQSPNLVVDHISTISIGPTWSQGNKKVYLKTVGLSDHYPVEIVLRWE